VWIVYRVLNDVTIKNKYPLPRIEDLFNQMRVVIIFSRSDLCSGYQQLKIIMEDFPKSTFTTRHSLYEFLVISFGLANTPANFLQLMNKVFMECRNKFVIVFIDNILVLSRSEEEREEHL